jgi:hypothetical protein
LTFPNDLTAERLFARAISHTEEFTADTFISMADMTAL